MTLVPGRCSLRPMMDVSATVVSARISTHWAAIISDGSTVILVAATVALVWATTRYLKPSVVLAREATRARVDDQAPRAYVTKVTHNPNVWYPSTADDGKPNRANASTVFVEVPSQNDQLLFVNVYLTIVNEGMGTGLLLMAPAPGELPGRIRIRDCEEGPLTLNPISLKGTPGAQTEIGVKIEVEMTVKEWLTSPFHVRHATIFVHDLFEDGVEDSIPLTITAQAVALDTQNHGRGILQVGLSPAPATAEVGKIHRRYRGEFLAAAARQWWRFW